MSADIATRCARVAVFALLAAAAGCRTVNDVMVDYRANLSRGEYAAAAREPAELAAKENGDRLLWRLMSAKAHDLAGETDLAIADFDVAEDIMIENDKSSVFSRSVDTANAMMLNDKYFPYDGGGQDRIFACMYKAIGYAQHQENWLYERRRNLAAAEERLQKESAEYSKEKGGEENAGQSNVAIQNAVKDGSFRETVKEAFGVDIFSSSTLDDLKPEDYQNPYLSHACGVFRWLDGDGDGRGHLKDALRLRPKNSVVRSDLEACEAGVKPSDEVWIYAEDGLAPAREAWRIDLPLLLIPYAERYVKYAGLALPRLLETPAAAMSWSAGGVAMEELASVEALAKIEYDVYMRGAIRREITRARNRRGARERQQGEVRANRVPVRSRRVQRDQARRGHALLAVASEARVRRAREEAGGRQGVRLRGRTSRRRGGRSRGELDGLRQEAGADGRCVR